MLRRLAIVAWSVLVLLTPALAEVNAREPDPAAWLRQVYDLYRRAETSPALESQANYRLIVKRASKSLAALFKRNDACESEQQGICALDWDFIVDGQDFKLSKVKVGATKAAGQKATVKVSFTNMGAACVNTYHFVHEDGRWKVDDVETKRGSEAPVSIARLLAEYDYKQ